MGSLLPPREDAGKMSKKNIPKEKKKQKEMSFYQIKVSVCYLISHGALNLFFDLPLCYL